jgi:hypothetical protein
VILEAPADERDVVCEQRRCQRVAGKRRIHVAVEPERDRPATIDAATDIEPPGLLLV